MNVRLSRASTDFSTLYYFHEKISELNSTEMSVAIEGKMIEKVHTKRDFHSFEEGNKISELMVFTARAFK